MKLTPKARYALQGIIKDNSTIDDAHWTHRKLFTDNDLIDETGKATPEGLVQSGLPLFDSTVMTIGADMSYGGSTLPKGTEVMVTWRSEPIRKRGRVIEIIDGYIMQKNGEPIQVRMYNQPKNTFEKRTIPVLEDKEQSDGNEYKVGR